VGEASSFPTAAVLFATFTWLSCAVLGPNYCNHDASCARNVQHAALSLFGFGRKDLVYDLKNSRHVVLQTRNLFESINVKEVNDLLEGMGNGCKLTVIDIRATVSSAKADRFLMIRRDRLCLTWP
jgi:thiosulfate reductase/polysulfide reductase chain A